MKKLISLMLILCMACMLVPAMADSGFVGVWYGEYSGTVMVIGLNEDGTCYVEVGGNRMSEGTWVENDGKAEITMGDPTGGASTQVATLADGVMTLEDANMSVSFTQEPIEQWQPAEVNPEAAAEDFDGDWTLAKVSMMGITADPAAAGMGDVAIKVEGGNVIFSGSTESLAMFVGNEPIQLNYENGMLIYSVDITEGMSLAIKAEILQDGMLALTFDIAGQAMALYFTKVVAE